MFIPNSPSPPSGIIHREGLLNGGLMAHFLHLSYHTECQHALLRHLREKPEIYSKRNASIGSSRAAFCAG